MNMPQTKVQIPLAVHIYWKDREKANEGSLQARLLRKYPVLLYDLLNRKTSDPLDRFLEIPVFLHPVPPGPIDELQLEKCRHSLHIVLIDDDLNVRATPAWKNFFRDLTQKVDQAGNGHRLLPVAVTENVQEFDLVPNVLQGLHLYKAIREKRDATYLLTAITNKLARMLYEEHPEGNQHGQASPLPVSIFMSHSKSDGAMLCKDFTDHTLANINVRAFFDAVHMELAEDFTKDIEKQIKNSVLLVFQTDSYSSRNWCRREVLLAKKHDRPILVVNLFDQGEVRSFPYIGNVTHIHYPLRLVDQEVSVDGVVKTEKVISEEDRTFLFDLILLACLQETLRFGYSKLQMKTQTKAFGIKVDQMISYAPELITLVHAGLENKEQTILYPDPPLGSEELELLQQLQPKTTFLTPALLPLFSNKDHHLDHLSKLKIGISLSEQITSDKADIRNRGIQDLVVDITKYLLVSGATLIYSGKLDYQAANDQANEFNYSQLLIDLIKTYKRQFDYDKRGVIKPLQAYSYFPLSAKVDLEKESKLKNVVDFVTVDLPKIAGLGIDQADEILEGTDYYHIMVWAESLRLMRLEMERTEHARIFLGGKWIGFKGRMAGVLEEFLIALEHGQPVFLLGGYGGVSGDVAAALQGYSPPPFNPAFYEQYYPIHPPFLERYNEEHPAHAVDYSQILEKLHEIGKKSEDFGLNNGLSREENLALFTSKFNIEIISLLLKGLKNIATS
jgi:hypothetical protein